VRRLGLATALVSLAIAACGGGDDPQTASTPDPDQPVQAPADPAPTAGAAPTPATPRQCRRVGRRVVGRSLGTARAAAIEAGCTLRVVIQDGEHLLVTEDFNASRINVRVDDDRVTAFRGLY
jgi:hypothetical protein